MQLVQMRGGHSNSLLYNLCEWRQTCANGEWNSVQCSLVMQFAKMRSGTQYNILYVSGIHKV